MRASLVDRGRHEARYWAEQASRGLRDHLARRRKRRVFRSWLRELKQEPPDVLLGANIDRTGGIRQHLLGIQRHSMFAVSLAPPDDVMRAVTYHDLQTSLQDDFLRFEPTPIRVIHSHVYPYFINWCAAKANRGCRWVHTYHALYHPSAQRPELTRWQEEINAALLGTASKAEVRISVSRWQKAYLEREHGISSFYLPNGVDLAVCDAGDPDRFRQAHGDRPFILFVGNTDPIKDPTLFIRLAARMASADFIMIGHGLDSPATLRWNVPLPANLRMLGGKPRNEVQDAIAACSALVVTSEREGLPTVVLEALAHGKPVVVPDDPGCREPLDGGEYGFVYAPGDLGHLAERTADAMSGPSRYQSARDRITAEYDWKVIAPLLDKIYSGGIDSGAG